MAANPFALPPNARFPTTSLYFTSSPFTRLRLTKISCFSTCQKSCKNRLLLSFRCATALTINGSVLAGSSILLYPLLQELGLNVKETEAILDRNETLRITPFESIRSRVQFLRSAGLSDIALPRLIVKQPDLLTSDEVDALLCFIVNDSSLGLRGKIDASQIKRLLNVTHTGLLAGFERKVRLLLQVGIPKEKLVHVLNNVNLIKALCLKTFEEIERTLAHLIHFGSVNLILRRPIVLNYDLETQLRPRIGFLLKLSGGDETAIGVVLRKFPSILSYRVEHLNDHVEFLNSYVGLSYEEIFKIVLVYPSVFSASIKRKLRPRIDFLKQCQLNSHDIFKFLTKAPLFLNLSFEDNLANKLVLLVKIGYLNRTKELALAMGAVTRCSCKNLQEVIGVYLNYGLTCEDILDMSKKHPQVLQYNHESLEEKLDYLIEEMGRDVGEVLSFPAFLGYKLDGRIKHRYEETRKILGEGMSINKLLSVSAASFSSKSKKKLPASMIQDLNKIED